MKRSVRVYRLLSRLYSSELRRLHAAEMEEAFLDLLARESFKRGIRGAIRVWAGAAVDAIRSRRTVRDRATSGLNLDRVRAEVRDVVRHLARRRARTVSVVMTMSVALTATLMAMVVAYEVTLKPLPFRDAGQLAIVTRSSPAAGALGVTLNDLGLFVSGSHSVQAVAAFNDFDATLFTGTTSLRVPGAYATASLSRVLGVPPSVGRWWSSEEDTPDAAPVAVLGHALAVQLFGATDLALSKQLRIQDQHYAIIGVMHDRFTFPIDAQFWIPAGRQPAYARSENLDLTGIVRLTDAAAWPVAAADALAVSSRLVRMDGNVDVRLTVSPLRDLIFDSQARRLSIPLMITAALTLLLAGASVANVFVMSMAERGVEFAVRRALGGGAAAATRLLVLEALILSTVAAVVAAVAAHAIGTALPDLLPLRLPAFVLFEPGGLLLAASAALAAATTVAGALIAASSAGRTLAPLVHTRGTTIDWGSLGPARVMAVVQCATACSLAGMAIWAAGNFRAFNAVDSGFDPSTLFVTYSLSADQRYDNRGTRETFLRSVLDKVQEIPGHLSSGVVGRRPLDFVQDEQWATSHSLTTPVRLTAATITPGYLAAAGIELMGGRDVVWSNRESDQEVVLVSRTAARLLWGTDLWSGEQVIRLSAVRDTMSGARPIRVIGLTEDTHPRGLDAPAAAAVYRVVPSQRWTPWVGHLAVRSTLPPQEVLKHVREIIAAHDPAVPIYRWRTMGELIDESLWRSRLAAWLLSALGVIALVVVVVGVHALVGALVSSKLRDLGIRAALGASGMTLGGTVAWSIAPLVLLGIGTGAILTSLLNGPLHALLPAATGLLWSSVTAALVLLVVMTFACAPAARRAARVDPVTLLRR